MTQNQNLNNNEYHLLIDEHNPHDQIKNEFAHDASDAEKINLQIRLGFVRKVYGILAAQLLLTTFFCILSMMSKSFLKFQQENFALLIFALIMTLVLPCFALCFDSLFKKVPINYIFLTTFTVLESYLIGYICGMTNPRVVLMAAFMTFAMVITLTIYAATTKSDFTLSGGLLFIFGTTILLFAIFAMFTQNKIIHIILSCLWIIVFGMYLIYDTQIILGNKELKLSLDDYILASFMLYLDVINLFINLLKILSLLSGSSE